MVYYLAGAKILKSNLANLYGIFTGFALAGVTTREERGYFVTSKMSAKNIDNIWKHCLVRYEPSTPQGGLQTGTFIVKYRTSNPSYVADYGYSGAWASYTTFTIASTSWPATAAIGDEVFVTQGDNQGGAAHILTITGTTTKTITLDEAICTSPVGNFQFILTNWKKINPNITDNTKGYQQLDISAPQADWIQFKVEIRENMMLEEMQIGYQENKKLEES